VDLSATGEHEAQEAGKLLREKGYEFDVAYTSVLRRAIRTLWFVLRELHLEWLPVTRLWRLNERHYGALQVRPWSGGGGGGERIGWSTLALAVAWRVSQGLNKAETAAKHGEDQVGTRAHVRSMLPGDMWVVRVGRTCGAGQDLAPQL